MAVELVETRVYPYVESTRPNTFWKLILVELDSEEQNCEGIEFQVDDVSEFEVIVRVVSPAPRINVSLRYQDPVEEWGCHEKSRTNIEIASVTQIFRRVEPVLHGAEDQEHKRRYLKCPIEAEPVWIAIEQVIHGREEGSEQVQADG